MPSTVVKLSSSDARAWSRNQPVWLRESGDVERPVTRQEQFAISTALAKSRNIDQSFRLALPLHEVVQNRKGVHSQVGRPRQGGKPPPLVVLDCAFEITIQGKTRTVTVWNGDLRYSTGRKVLEARLLADHGECVLHRSNGKCIGVLRDPFVRERPRATGPRVQRSRNPHELSQQRAARKLPQRSVSRTATRSALYSPDQCPNDCRGRKGGPGSEWALAKGATPPTDQQHHPICKYAGAWNETVEGVATNAVLYDLELSKIARVAMPQEIAEAGDAERRTGIRQITVAGRIFAVLPTEEAEQAAAEARGETYQAAPKLHAAPYFHAAPKSQQGQRGPVLIDEPAARPLPMPRRAPVPPPASAPVPVPTAEPSNWAEPSSPDLGDELEGDETGDELDRGSESELPAPELGTDIGSELDDEIGGGRDDSAPPEPEEGPPVALMGDAASTPAQRGEWPTLEQILPVENAEAYRRRSEVTAGNYLARKSPGAART